MIYYLSSAQHKQLTDRMGPLLIVLPAPEEDPTDWLTWARNQISAKHRQYVAAASVGVLRVQPPGGTGLQAVIGQISTHSDDALTWCIEVVFCDLNPPMAARHPRSAPQWPASVDTESAAGKFPKERASVSD